MGLCTRRRIWLLLITLLKWHELASGLWFVKEPVSHLPDEVDHALAVCQGSNMILNCRNRYNKIVVKDTFYGRKDNHTCSSKIFDTEKLCDQPTPDNIKKKVDIMCTGEYKCKVPVTPAFLEKKGVNMCPSSRKYLQITYACHQDPKLHMVCYNNCTSKCWPLCQKECCEPPKPVEVRHEAPPPAAAKPAAKAVEELTKTPQELTCRGSCPNRCAPQCDITCCETKPQPKSKPLTDSEETKPVETKTTHAEVKSCSGDCLNICAPLCRPSCCARHKKSTATLHIQNQTPKPPLLNYNQFPHAPPITQPFVTSCPVDCQGKCQANCPQVCCAQMTKEGNPYYVEPASARAQCPVGCSPTCAPSCAPQCCAYNRVVPGLSRTGYYGAQQPVAPIVAAPQPYAAYAQQQQQQLVQPQMGYAQQAVARDRNQPLVTGQTLEVEVPNMNYKNSLQSGAQTYQRVYPEPPAGQVPLGCPASCARSCDVSCKLGCCAPASTYFFSTHPISDNDQRRTYELLLAKYRNNQLQKYYQNTRAFTG